jgi:hypothetical protein
MFKKILPFFYHALLTLLVYVIHVNEKVNSMLNDFKAEIDQGYLKEVYEFHKTGQAAFMKRPITTFLIEKIHQFFSIEIGTSFVLLNFSCLFLSSLLLFYLSKLLTKSTLKAYVNSLIFFLCGFFHAKKHPFFMLVYNERFCERKFAYSYSSVVCVKIPQCSINKRFRNC